MAKEHPETNLIKMNYFIKTTAKWVDLLEFLQSKFPHIEDFYEEHAELSFSVFLHKERVLYLALL
jgi:hypothetical protein